MLQRPQTLFLALIIVSMGLFLGFPVWEKTVGGQSATLSAFSLTYTNAASQVVEESKWYLAALAILAAGLALFSLVQFTNRVRQMLLNLVNTLVMIALLGLSTYESHIKANGLFNPETPGSFKIGFFAIAVALLANVAANRFIRIDERKVKDAFERLR
ncbi:MULTISPECIES: DUF4293 family protein [unclassified Siphonobacter]|uniref:DUF4293 family protein n=1 Tax=unclassified Siphonobacter TaxID=2635712 RepID=UPI000CA9996F|nr:MULTISPECIES: DUF4293 family protein [unclassified Siphonobacter]MDQ1087344.1 glucan phosphoethanolaminetransferase (alkaline phosphatase superfamily) [Siphonobacter sp. SORGH_AS_1065]PKK36363.1 hypothetical protein BWI96_10860 [Siphonobacter sp. SORGH_AS_0500]